MDSMVDISDSKSGCKDRGGWLERLSRSNIQRILDNRNKYDKTESSNSSLMLPDTIIQEILSRLPITYVVQCSLLCKSFEKELKSQKFASKHIEHGSDNSPFLIFHYGHLGSYPDYLGRLNLASVDGYVGMVKRIDIPFKEIMVDYSVIGSCYGYLCLVSDESRLVKRRFLLYNPLTGHFKELPEQSQVPDFLFAYGFGYDVGTKEYKVLMASYGKKQSNEDRMESNDEKKQLEVQILTNKMNMWRTLQTPSCWLNEGGASRRFMHDNRALWITGSLHWLTKSERAVISEDQEHTDTGPQQQIITFDLAAEEFQEITPPTGSTDLLSVRGNLSALVNHEQGSWEIWVMKDYDDVPGSWTRDFVLGHYVPAALRLSNNSKDNDLRNVRVVCRLNNGKFLLRFGHRAWCYYDPETELYEDLTLDGLPKEFVTIAHVGCLNHL